MEFRSAAPIAFAAAVTTELAFCAAVPAASTTTRSAADVSVRNNIVSSGDAKDRSGGRVVACTAIYRYGCAGVYRGCADVRRRAFWTAPPVRVPRARPEQK